MDADGTEDIKAVAKGSGRTELDVFGSRTSGIGAGGADQAGISEVDMNGQKTIGGHFSSFAQNVSGQMYREEPDMLSLLSSVANSEQNRQERQAKKLEELGKGVDTRVMRQNMASSPSSSSSSSSSNEEDEDSDAESSELDEEDCDRIRSQCLDEMSTIEKQFTDIRDQLYQERHSQITSKLKEVQAETAAEYLNPFNILKRGKETRIEVCEKLRELQKNSIKCWYQSQGQANSQHFENEKTIMSDGIRAGILERIKMLEEDRDNVDFSTELWTDTALANAQKSRSASGGSSGKSSMWTKGSSRKTKKGLFNFGFANGNHNKRKKKPVTVSGPYIVYMLKEDDIVDDWTVIKRALTASKRRKTGYKDHISKLKHTCRIDNRRLQYDGRWFQRGQTITMKGKEMSNTHATITSIGTNELTVRQSNSTLVKINVQQLIKGKYLIRPR